MSIGRLIGATVAVAFMMMVFGLASSAQAPAPGPATNSDLLIEIRGLRADLNQALSANIRAQLLVGRLQLQEQRISVISEQLAEARRALGVVEASEERAAADLKRMEESRRGSLTPEFQAETDGRIAELRAELRRAQHDDQNLRAEESELAAQLDAELNRWSSFNERLDEIERALPATPPSPVR